MTTPTTQARVTDTVDPVVLQNRRDFMLHVLRFLGERPEAQNDRGRRFLSDQRDAVLDRYNASLQNVMLTFLPKARLRKVMVQQFVLHRFLSCIQVSRMRTGDLLHR